MSAQPSESLGVDLERMSNLGARVGRVGLALEVHGWAMKHFNELSTEAMRELCDIITQAQA